MKNLADVDAAIAFIGELTGIRVPSDNLDRSMEGEIIFRVSRDSYNDALKNIAANHGGPGVSDGTPEPADSLFRLSDTRSIRLYSTGGERYFVSLKDDALR